MKRLCGSGFIPLLLLLAPYSAMADNDVSGLPPRESADLIIDDFDAGLEGAPKPDVPFDEFLDKSHLRLKLRNYYLNRSRPENTDPLAWAQGGSFEYNIDKLGGFLGFNAEYFGSFELYAPEDHDGTLLLGPGQTNLDTLGVLNPKLTHWGQVISVYRQKIDLPYLNSQDNRMIPNTFEAYTLGMPKTENETFQYMLGYVAEMKKRNEESFQSMTEVAGVPSEERGMLAGGARYFIVPDLSVGAVDYFVEDTLNIFYTELAHKKKFNDSTANAFSAQYSPQNSVGDDLIRGGINYSTGFWGIQDAVSYKNATIKLAYTHDDTGGDIRSPYGSYPGYNSVIVEDFNRAGEKAWQLGLQYNFARLGLKELGLSTCYVNGFDAIDETTKLNIPNKNETDVTLDYKVADGLLKGLWVRLRGAFIEEDGHGTTEDYRIIVNYEIPLYEPEKDSDAT